MDYLFHDNIFTGGFFVLAGLSALVRQSLLEPDSPQYPKAPAWLRMCMFGFSAVLMFTGLHYISSPHDTAGPTRLLAIALVLYNVAMLGNVVRQRYPEDVWDRLNRVNERISCSNNSFHRWLSK